MQVDVLIKLRFSKVGIVNEMLQFSKLLNATIFHENDFDEEGQMFQLDVWKIVKIRNIMTIEMERNVPTYTNE